MKAFKNYWEIPDKYSDIRRYAIDLIGDGQLGTNFQMLLGGDLYLFEYPEEIPLLVDKLRNADLKQNLENHFGFVCINNNSGGPTYLIPKTLIDKKGHITRYSDSSLYDSVCILCNKTEPKDECANKIA